MPLHAWCYENFLNIGCIWGQVLAIEEVAVECQSYEKCRLNIITDCHYSLNEKVILEVDGQSFMLRIIEEEGILHHPHSCCPKEPGSGGGHAEPVQSLEFARVDAIIQSPLASEEENSDKDHFIESEPPLISGENSVMATFVNNVVGNEKAMVEVPFAKDGLHCKGVQVMIWMAVTPIKKRL